MHVTEKKEDFLKTLHDDLEVLLKHDFLAKSQASYFAKMKETVAEGTFVISLDFAENYSFSIQDAIQSQHWSKQQATVHPYVVYYRENGKTKHDNLVIISEKLGHDANAVHLFNSKAIAYLKKKFGESNVKMIIYFSDGAGSQYKNKFNFVNLVHHKTDFGVNAEWNFSATPHGKEVCDGIGGSVKRHAFKTSLQLVDGNQISTPKQLFEWAQGFFKKITFDFCTQTEHDLHDQKYEKRFKTAITVKNTRMYHQYLPLDDKNIACKIFSHDSSFVKIAISK